MPHTLNIFFCRDLKKVHFIFQTPLTVKIEKWWGGYHPLGWNLLKMGGNSPPGGISPPFPFCQIWEGGDITTFLESYAKWGGFHTWGGYHPLVPIWPQSTGAPWTTLFSLIHCTSLTEIMIYAVVGFLISNCRKRQKIFLPVPWAGILKVKLSNTKQCLHKCNLVLRTWGQKLFNGKKRTFE